MPKETNLSDEPSTAMVNVIFDRTKASLHTVFGTARLEREIRGPAAKVGVGVVLGAGTLPAALTAGVSLLVGAPGLLTIGLTVGVLVIFAMAAYFMSASSAADAVSAGAEDPVKRAAIEPGGTVESTPEKPSKVPVRRAKGARQQGKGTADTKGKHSAGKNRKGKIHKGPKGRRG